MQFRSELNRPTPHQYAQRNFKKYLDVYEDVINEKTGKMETVITDKVLVDEKIQESKDMVTLDSILERYKVDLSKQVIKEISEDVIDMTVMPQDALEAYSLINEAKKNFEETTSEFKKEFNNDFGQYVAGFKNGKTQEIINKHNKHITKKQAPTQPVQQPVQQQAVQQQVQQTVQPTQQVVQQNVQPTNQNINIGGNTYNV